MKKKYYGLFLIPLTMMPSVNFGSYYGIGNRYKASYKKSDVIFDISSQRSDEKALTVMSYNVRTLSKADKDEKSWYCRADYVVRTVAEAKPDIIGFQEAMRKHVDFFKKHLKGYTFVETYRDKKLFSEGTTVAFATDRFEEKERRHLWLSDTPEKQSKLPGSRHFRDVTALQLFDRRTNKTFFLYNTHLGIHENVRVQQMRILKNIIIGNDAPVVLIGDFNDYDDSETYKIASSFLSDARLCARASDKDGATFHGYGLYPDERRIDYCFTSDGFSVDSYSVNRTVYDGIYPSDHFPLIISLR